MKDQKPSEVIGGFLDWLELCRKEHEEAYLIVGEEDRRLQDLVHAMEFASDKQERNRIATKLQQSRKRRRQAKDKTLELDKICRFYKDQTNRPLLKKLKVIIQEQKKTEEYLASDRKYNPRVGDDSVDDS